MKEIETLVEEKSKEAFDIGRTVIDGRQKKRNKMMNVYGRKNWSHDL